MCMSAQVRALSSAIDGSEFFGVLAVIRPPCASLVFTFGVGWSPRRVCDFDEKEMLCVLQRTQ